MQNNLIKYSLIVILFIVYFLLFNVVWPYLPIGDTSIGVLIGSLFVLLFSLILAIISSKKVLEFVRRF